jgi:hypothetical protein
VFTYRWQFIIKGPDVVHWRAQCGGRVRKGRL